jgi:tetratricopeptide (TPR) repeat protein
MDTRDEARQEAERLIEALEAGPRSRMLMQLKNLESYASEPLARVLIERAVVCRRAHHQGSFEYADAAAAVARRLEGRRYAAVRARAQAELANAWRNLNRFEQAAKALAAAERELKAPEAEDEYAHVMLIKAGLVRDLGHYDEAANYAREAEIEFGYLDDFRNETTALILQGQIYTLAKRFESAQKVLNEAVARMRPDPWDPRLLVAAYGNTVFNAVEWGAAQESPADRIRYLTIALVMLADARPVIDEHGSVRDQINARWASARVLGYLGQYDAAAAKYREIVGELESLDEPITSAFAILELCGVLSRSGELAEARDLACEAAQRFASAGLPEHLKKALLCISRAETLLEVERLVLETLKKCGAPKTGAPWVGYSAC